jgi:PPE-repeat protein
LSALATLLDFGALPPEVNSGRIYAGPGSGPIMAAASAWQSMAGQLESIVRGYSSVLSGLQAETWSGNASTAMADAAEPFVGWIATPIPDSRLLTSTGRQ